MMCLVVEEMRQSHRRRVDARLTLVVHIREGPLQKRRVQPLEKGFDPRVLGSPRGRAGPVVHRKAPCPAAEFPARRPQSAPSRCGPPARYGSAARECSPRIRSAASGTRRRPETYRPRTSVDWRSGCSAPASGNSAKGPWGVLGCGVAGECPIRESSPEAELTAPCRRRLSGTRRQLRDAGFDLGGHGRRRIALEQIPQLGDRRYAIAAPGIDIGQEQLGLGEMVRVDALG